MHHRIIICKESGSTKGISRLLIKRSIKAALKYEGVNVPCEINVLITDDDGIRNVNRDFRQIDRATDVLSFPAFNFTPESFDADDGEFDPETGRLPLGDMMLSAEHIIAQAASYGHSCARETGYLTVHSVLHLLGYDHMDDGPQKKQMRQHEEAILQKLHLARQYVE